MTDKERSQKIDYILSVLDDDVYCVFNNIHANNSAFHIAKFKDVVNFLYDIGSDYESMTPKLFNNKFYYRFYREFYNRININNPTTLTTECGQRFSKIKKYPFYIILNTEFKDVYSCSETNRISLCKSCMSLNKKFPNKYGFRCLLITPNTIKLTLLSR